MLDLSDESTDLPPLEEIDPAQVMLALRFQVAGGIATADIPETGPTAMHLVAARGLVVGEDGELTWTQAHIAIPRELVRPLLQEWLDKMDRGLL